MSQACIPISSLFPPGVSHVGLELLVRLDQIAAVNPSSDWLDVVLVGSWHRRLWLQCVPYRLGYEEETALAIKEAAALPR